MAHKYQTEATLLKIDTVLATSLNEKKYKNIDELINDILEAELYTQPKYLQACINKAYTTFTYKELTNAPKFHNVSNDTKFTVLSKRCEKLELGNKTFLQELDKINTCFECRHERIRIQDVARKILSK